MNQSERMAAVRGSADRRSTYGRYVELRASLRSLGPYFAHAAGFSLAINLLYLAAPLYMMQVYDRVLSSSSEATLILLTLIVLAAFAALAGLDCVRARILARASTRLDRILAPRVLSSMIEPATLAAPRHGQALRDVETLKLFVSGSGMHAIFDFPWTPIYVLIIFLLHPALGTFALLCAILLVLMAMINEIWVREISARANEASGRMYGLTEQSLRNAEVIQAMGLLMGLVRKWVGQRNSILSSQQIASERAAIVASIIRFLRLAMQSVILGLGAWLVIERLTSPGAMFASSILLGRALQPVEQAAGSWRSMIAAHAALVRLSEVLETNPAMRPSPPTPRPPGDLAINNLAYAAPGLPEPILRNVTFRLAPAEAVAVLGSSGAGKSTLARSIVGVLQPSAGSMLLAGIELSRETRDAMRQHIGYLPQDIELFADSVAANISGFKEHSEAAVVRAAQMAGVHEMVSALPAGYQTEIGKGGIELSGGWQQRIALARAVFGSPSLVVLDEPNSNLDAQGEEALARCIRLLKLQGATVVVISHRPSMLRVVDKILLLRSGTVEWFGPREEILRRIAANDRGQRVADHVSG